MKEHRLQFFSQISLQVFAFSPFFLEKTLDHSAEKQPGCRVAVEEWHMNSAVCQEYITTKWSYISEGVRQAIVRMEADPVHYGFSYEPLFPGEPPRSGPLMESERRELVNWVTWARAMHEPIQGMLALIC
jgi:hypothetical protein